MVAYITLARSQRGKISHEHNEPAAGRWGIDEDTLTLLANDWELAQSGFQHMLAQLDLGYRGCERF